MRRTANPRVLWLLLATVFILAGWIFSTPAVSQPVSQGRIGAPRTSPRPGERVAAYRFVWFAQNKSANFVFQTADSMEHVISGLNTDQLTSLLDVVRSEGPIYFEQQGQLLYSGYKALPTRE